MSTFLHYVHCKDALLDCSAPGGERCESLTGVDEITGTNFTTGFWAHYWNLVKMKFSHFNSNDQIRSQFCTCHDSWAVVACAKLWPDLIVIFHICKNNSNSCEIWIMSWYTIVRWVSIMQIGLPRGFIFMQHMGNTKLMARATETLVEYFYINRLFYFIPLLDDINHQMKLFQKQWAQLLE